MEKIQILVVEDESIVALDLRSQLTSLGYAVPAMAASGKEAIRRAKEVRPDLVLMDIKLKGDMDGVEAAEQIRARFGIPVIYLTAYADAATLERAKITGPFGYILKPFGERELSSTIETALYRHELEQRLRESEQWLSATLKSIGDAVIATDDKGRIRFINPVAEALTGWKQERALGQDIARVLRIVDGETRAAVENPAVEALREGAVLGLRKHIVLIARDGRETAIDDSVAPIKDKKGNITGVVLVFRDISRRRRTEQLLQTLNTAALAMQKALTHKEIFAAVAGELSRLDLACMIFPADEDQSKLFPKYMPYESKAVQAVEKLVGLDHKDFSIPVQAVDVYKKVIWERRTVFVERAEDVIRQLLPKPVKRFAGQIARILSTPKAILASLIVEDRVIGLLSVQSDDLLQADAPAITAFAHQVAAAWHRAQLFQQAQQEIAERKLAQEALRENEKRYRQLVEHAPAGIYEIDLLNGKFISVNDVMCEYTGYTKEEFLSLHPLDILTEESKERFFERQAKTLAKEPIPETVEYKIIGKNEREFWVILNSRLEYEKEIPRATVVVYDITERKQTEEQVLHLQNLLQNITDSMPSALVTLDPAGRVLTWNPAAQALTGRAAAQVQGQSLWQTCPELARYRDLVERVLREGQVTHRPREQLALETGTITCDVSVFPLADNGITGAVLRIDDVTQRMQFEEMMLQSAKMASVGKLAAGVAHEINNPLGGMMQSAQLLQMALDTQRPRTRERLQADGVDPGALEHYVQTHNLHEYLDGIRSAGGRAAKIVADLLSFSRKSSSDVAPHDLNMLVEQTLALAAADYDLKKHYDFRDIEIVRELAPNLPKVVCDGQQIQQVVLNLVRNAAQAMAGEIERGDREHQSRLTLRTSLAPSFVRLEVEDNGPGIPEAIRTRLFEPFFTTKEVGRGTGLGLWVCWSVVERHKGQMWVEPVPPAPDVKEGSRVKEPTGLSGSRFVVELPVN